MNNEIEVFDDERIDSLEIKDYKIIQKTKGFCFGMDAVLLSDFANVKKGGKSLDLCSGTGVIPILMEAKGKGELFKTLEIQKIYAQLIERNIKLNKLENKFETICGDLKEWKKYFKPNEFDTVTCNPPYMKDGSAIKNAEDLKLIARHEILCNLEDVITCAFNVLKVKGHFYMVHRAYRTADILALLTKHKLEPKRIRYVYPNNKSEANIILVDAVKCGKPECRIEKPLIVYGDDNLYTQELYDIYGMENPNI